ncbi:T9SS type A sorting domain-containing protein [Pontibacter sp. Tf4]|uniref:T9SS type A sorting domain-containing protein n=1 Tax=Pontibacter sp. Tf4 TaxID=2761620 RepID=UPI001629C3E8|nr:T9SS type A sorting domain-containing protein [Pontibacter sp. Tf4]MBB6612969.1 T9SS type A sorting domain-containing protein [Pontibacter sp. Tf4]
MKNFTYCTILLSSILIALPLHQTLAQATPVPDPQPCTYTYNDCFRIGYVSVTPAINQGGGPQNDQLDVELFFQDICDIVSEITVTPTQGQDHTIPDSEISAEVNTYPFKINANTFKDGILKVTIWLDNGEKVMVDLWYDESFECGDITPLPVELTSFKGKATESGIDLKWETASELNNSHFDVERSADGKSFKSIATVQGRGTTSTPQSYSLLDKLPLRGINYYRLKQVDFDNTHSYSATVAVAWDAGDAMQAAILPNPCENRNCNITISNAANQQTILQLKDVAGRVVYTKTITSRSHLFELPMHELPKLKGLYFLTATMGNQVVHQRVVLE